MDAEKVTTGVRRSLGGVYRAPLDTELPTDAVTALGTDFVEQGYVSEDGITMSHSFESADIKEWGGKTVLSISTSRNVTCQMKFIESLNTDLLETIYGEGNVTGTIDTGIQVTDKDEDPGASIWVIDMACNNGSIKRLVFPRATITDMGDEVYKRDEATGFDITLTLLPDSSGNKMYEYINEGEAESE